MPDRTCKTPSVSFDDDNTSPIVLPKMSIDGNCLFERLLSINHVSTVNPSTKFQMSSINSKKPNSSSAVSTARPFDEFSMDITTTPIHFLDGQTTKLDKD